MAESSVYVAAHADDWQLFMSPTALHDLDAAAATGRRLAFVHLTTGDDGEDSRFWRAREIGAVNSIRYGLGLHLDLDPEERRFDAVGRPLARYDVGPNATAYFLRLPDGNMDGSGYEVTGRQSLRRSLADGVPLASLVASDGNAPARYDTADDVVAVVRALLHHESVAGATTRVHYLDPRTPNPVPGEHWEHADHIATGTIVEAAMDGDDRFQRRTYLDYDSRLRPANVTGTDFQRKLGMFLAYSFATRVASGDTYPVTVAMDEYQAWLEREIVTNVR